MKRLLLFSLISLSLTAIGCMSLRMENSTNEQKEIYQYNSFGYLNAFVPNPQLNIEKSDNREVK